jgi:hypothetical protein
LFGARVQMWHIGVRDEAKRLDGIGRCGRQFCSASWLPELRPVKSSIAKDQRLSTLNPSQISGSCGRLMCCLRYEHEFYVQQRKRFPKEGKIIVTAGGEEKIVSNDIFREQVTLRNTTGEVRTVPLAQLNRELGGAPIMTAADLDDSEPDSDIDEEMTGEYRADTRTYPSAKTEDRTPKTEDQRPKSEDRRPKTEDRKPAVTSQQQEQQQPSDGPGRRRRRRGRRGGRRGRDGGGQPGGPPAPPTPPAGS